MRTLRSSGRHVFSGSYSARRLPGADRPSVHVAFPLESGNVQVFLRPSVTDDGGLLLESPPGRFGEVGAYVVVRERREVAAHLPRHETFHVYVDARGVLRTDHELRVRGMSAVRLGAPTLSPDRLQLRRIAVFAQWRDEAALERFLVEDALGRHLADGWHVRLEFLRRWSTLAALPDLPASNGRWQPDEPVVAVTVARMRLSEVPRFLHWGKPVERLVRDHPGVTLALAGFRPPRTIATFSVWRSVREMDEMVHGRSAVPQPERHAAAMAERARRDFHREFATFRFRPLSERGAWEGRSGIVPSAG